MYSAQNQILKYVFRGFAIHSDASAQFAALIKKISTRLGDVFQKVKYQGIVFPKLFSSNSCINIVIFFLCWQNGQILNFVADTND